MYVTMSHREVTKGSTLLFGSLLETTTGPTPGFYALITIADMDSELGLYPKHFFYCLTKTPHQPRGVNGYILPFCIHVCGMVFLEDG